MLSQVLRFRNDQRKREAVRDVGATLPIINERDYNLLFQQVSSDRKVEYTDQKALLIAR